MTSDFHRDYTIYRDDLLRFAQYVVQSFINRSDKEQAEEFTQIVMLRAIDPNDSLNKLLKKLEDPRQIKRYLKTTLRNEFINHLRNRKKEQDQMVSGGMDFFSSDQDHPDQLARSESRADKAKQTLCMRFAGIRQTLDKLSADWPSSRSVNYYAVFLLHLRKNLLRKVVHSIQSSPTNLTLPSMLRLSRYMIPWHPAEETMSFLTDYPGLHPLWRDFELRIAILADITDTTIIGVVNHHLGNDRALELNTYQQWNLRSKRIARNTVETEEWESGIGLVFRSRA